jgi:hypothetical protein
MDDKESVYWILWCLWQSKAFYPFLRGSVIPFITIGDFQKLLIKTLNQLPSPGVVLKVVDVLNKFQAIEDEYYQKIKLLKEAKRMVLYKMYPK